MKHSYSFAYIQTSKLYVIFKNITPKPEGYTCHIILILPYDFQTAILHIDLDIETREQDTYRSICWTPIRASRRTTNRLAVYILQADHPAPHHSFRLHRGFVKSSQNTIGRIIFKYAYMNSCLL